MAEHASLGHYITFLVQNGTLSLVQCKIGLNGHLILTQEWTKSGAGIILDM